MSIVAGGLFLKSSVYLMHSYQHNTENTPSCQGHCSTDNEYIHSLLVLYRGSYKPTMSTYKLSYVVHGPDEMAAE